MRNNANQRNIKKHCKKMKKYPNGKLHFFCTVKEADDKSKL